MHYDSLTNQYSSLSVQQDKDTAYRLSPPSRGEADRYAKAMIDFIIRTFCEQYSILQAGTGDSPLTIPFYEKCGFVRSHIIPHFFLDNYDHPIYEGGVQLADMVYMRRSF